jgi:hypothetical protein
MLPDRLHVTRAMRSVALPRKLVAAAKLAI